MLGYWLLQSYILAESWEELAARKALGALHSQITLPIGARSSADLQNLLILEERVFKYPST